MSCLFTVPLIFAKLSSMSSTSNHPVNIKKNLINHCLTLNCMHKITIYSGKVSNINIIVFSCLNTRELYPLTIKFCVMPVHGSINFCEVF